VLWHIELIEHSHQTSPTSRISTKF